MEAKKVKAPKDKSVKRVRRSPETLIKELNKKMIKLEERVYKKNSSVVNMIGKAILKKANFDFSDIEASDIESLREMDARGEEIIRDILNKIR